MAVVQLTLPSTSFSLTTMSTAKDKVIITPELLELILSQLPIRNLFLVAPLVSKTWQAVARTPVLQRAIFFEPDPSATVPTQNPLLVEIFSPFFAQANEESSWPGSVSTIQAMQWAKNPNAFKRADASWRRMLVTQPPVQSMAMTRTAGRHSLSGRRAVLTDLTLRMGMLYDLVVTRLEAAESHFRIRWQDGVDHSEDGISVDSWSANNCGSRTKRLGKVFISDGMERVKVRWETVDLGLP
jgi:hypothetical protein